MHLLRGIRRTAEDAQRRRAMQEPLPGPQLLPCAMQSVHNHAPVLEGVDLLHRTIHE